MLEVTTRPAGVWLLGNLGIGARRLGLLRFASWVGLDKGKTLGPYFRLAPFLSPSRMQGSSDWKDHARGASVNLFTGCVSQISQPQTLTAAKHLLENLGWRVRIPHPQRCCGALFRHNGFPAQADRVVKQTAAELKGRPTVAIASACVAELQKSAGNWLETEEICEFLYKHSWSDAVHFRALNRAVVVHEPCSHRNQLGQTQAVYALLGRIPGIALTPLPDNAFCCGAAGSYLLQQPEMARRLLADKLVRLRELQPQILVTTNTGCALHLGAGVREAGLNIEVCHPVDLLDRQLEVVQPRSGNPDT